MVFKEVYENGNITFEVNKTEENGEIIDFWLQCNHSAIRMTLDEMYDMVQLVGTYIEEELIEILLERMNSEEVQNV